MNNIIDYILRTALMLCCLLCISTNIEAQSTTLKVEITNELGEPMPNVQVATVYNQEWKLSDNSGTVSLALPQGAAPKEDVRIGIPTDYKKQSMTYEKGHILRIVLQYVGNMLKGELLDEDFQTMKGKSVRIEGANMGEPITTNAEGKFEVSLPKEVRFSVNLDVFVEGYKLDKETLRYDDSRKFLRIIYKQPVAKTYQREEPRQIKVADTVQKNETQEQQEGVISQDSGLVMPDSLYGFTEDFNQVLNEIELEKQILAERGLQIRQELEQVLLRLTAQPELSPKQRDSLGRYVERLENALVANDVAFEEAQAKTRAVVNKIRHLIDEKDSLNVVVTQQMKNEQQQARKQMIILASVIAVLLILATIFYLFWRRIHRQQSQLREVNKALELTKDELVDKMGEINRRKEEVLIQSKNLEKLNSEITFQNQKITDGIRYAQKIQEAILPVPKAINDIFDAHFIVYMPKDIVSGDFYWITKIITQERKVYRFVAAIDCTGHGVSGAFMSMIGNTLLTEIVNQKHVYEPAEILEQLNEGVKASLRQEESVNDDGMDVCLCRIEDIKENQKLEVVFAGARRPLYYTEGEGNLKIFKGDLKNIGGRHRNSRFFENKTIHISYQDTLYLTSDGAADQNGVGKPKFGSRKLKKLLGEISCMPVEKQKEAFEQVFQNYMGTAEQRDDITIVAIRPGAYQNFE
ncbi:MAG: SpoIIE family protein phosphatase [Bernardetiaceae bacterium]|nr:SpoIIE family protein phosphatase [Bernardetiaceae bacterium]